MNIRAMLSTRRRSALCAALLLLAYLAPSRVTAQESDNDTIVVVVDTLIEAPPPVPTSDTITVYHLKRLEDITASLGETSRLQRRILDTAGIAAGLPRLRYTAEIIENNLLEFGDRLNLRTLSSMRITMQGVRQRLADWQDDLRRHENRMAELRVQIDDMVIDTGMRILPADTLLQERYARQLALSDQEWTRADSLLRHHNRVIGLLLNEVNGLFLLADNLMEEIEGSVQRYSRQVFQRQYGFIWDDDAGAYSDDLPPVIQRSTYYLLEAIRYFMGTNWGYRLVNIAIIIFFYIFARQGIRRVLARNGGDEHVFRDMIYLRRHPFLSALVVGLTIAPFIYFHPPLVYIELMWQVLVVGLTVLVWRQIPPRFRSLWLLAAILFLLYSFSNLLVETTRAERWLVFGFSFAAVILGYRLLSRKSEIPMPYPTLWRLIIWQLLLQNAAALVLNLLGWYNWAKVLGASGLFGLVFAVNLWVFIDLIGDAFSLQVEANRSSFNNFSWFNYQDTKNRLLRLVTFFAIVFWVLGFAKNLNLYDYFYETLSAFLTEERQIGSAVFTFGGILVFVLVIWIATFLARLINYFYSNSQAIAGLPQTKALGSYLLLIRLGVIAIGFLIALSAAGIALSNVAIVLGALSVGIGFGLQNIVNNLVSGVILAFERPIQVGDTIEVGARIGKVKEIGIRSSKISTFDGAEIIVPNGDLLSQHLVNWTLSNNNRRVELIVGVAYGSNIERVHQAIARAIEKQDNIMPFPEPLILVHNFSDSSVDFRILFWTNDIGKWLRVKSEVLSKIYEEFYRAGIEIPFPKRDVYVHMREEKISEPPPANEKEARQQEEDNAGKKEREEA
jgi:potassium efflux system protein